MQKLRVRTPSELWLGLGKNLFDHYDGMIDSGFNAARPISTGNVLEVTEWNQDWTGKAFYDCVGYKPNGSKMRAVREKYVDEHEFDKFKKILKEERVTKGSRFGAVGMNFKMPTCRKGGCLSSFHLTRTSTDFRISVMAKIVEVPKKFTADLRLIADLIRECEIPHQTVQVSFYVSNIWYSFMALRVYFPFLGIYHEKFKGMNLVNNYAYQMAMSESIDLHQMMMEYKYGDKIWRKGCIEYIDLDKGEWKQ